MIPACDQKHCTPPTTTACAVMMRTAAVVTTMAASSEFPDAVCLWWIHSFYWNIMIVFCGISCLFLTLACVTSEPYRIVLRAYRSTYRSLCIGDMPVYRFSPTLKNTYFRLSVRPSVTLFDNVPVIGSSWNFQEILPLTDMMSMQKVKGQGHRGHDPTKLFPDRNSSLNSNMVMKWCTKLDVA